MIKIVLMNMFQLFRFQPTIKRILCNKKKKINNNNKNFTIQNNFTLILDRNTSLDACLK